MSGSIKALQLERREQSRCIVGGKLEGEDPEEAARALEVSTQRRDSLKKVICGIGH